MSTESVDHKTGTILFHEDEEDRARRILLERILRLEEKVSSLENIITKLVESSK